MGRPLRGRAPFDEDELIVVFSNINMRFLLTITIGVCLATVASAQNLSPRVEQALSYLPPQSETLAVAQTSLTIPSDKDGGSKAELLTPETAGFANLQVSVIAPALIGRTVELSLEARSNFRPPGGFGMMPYDGCGLLYLKPQPGQTRDDLKAKVWKGMKMMTLAGQEVGVIEQKREQDLWRTYVAVPRPDLIAIATDRASMITTLARMQRPNLTDRAIPSSWSGWKLLDTTSPSWAVRRLDLPQSVGLFGPHERDPKARALVIYLRVRPGKKSDWVIKSDGNPKNMRSLFTSINREVKGTITSPKGAQITQFDVSSPDGYFAFYALGLLGTGIYL